MVFAHSIPQASKKVIAPKEYDSKVEDLVDKTPRLAQLPISHFAHHALEFHDPDSTDNTKKSPKLHEAHQSHKATRVIVPFCNQSHDHGEPICEASEEIEGRPGLEVMLENLSPLHDHSALVIETREAVYQHVPGPITGRCKGIRTDRPCHVHIPGHHERNERQVEDKHPYACDVVDGRKPGVRILYALASMGVGGVHIRHI
mmetsp:Transcript_44343/g.102424  ORF Transcript_44343/g.102424 Transcript_44343/m.102424 type:complete len:202 (-) Transcript_44343:828-1433(-)